MPGVPDGPVSLYETEVRLIQTFEGLEHVLSRTTYPVAPVAPLGPVAPTALQTVNVFLFPNS